MKKLALTLGFLAALVLFAQDPPNEGEVYPIVKHRTPTLVVCITSDGETGTRYRCIEFQWNAVCQETACVALPDSNG